MPIKDRGWSKEGWEVEGRRQGGGPACTQSQGPRVHILCLRMTWLRLYKRMHNAGTTAGGKVFPNGNCKELGSLVGL